MVAIWTIAAGEASGGEEGKRAADEFAPGVAYTNYLVRSVPWSVHVVRVARGRDDVEVHSAHAGGLVCELGTLSELVRAVAPEAGKPVAGVNGDFYLRDRTYAGDPRGLQIVDGDLTSAPRGASFWIDGEGQPHAANVTARFQVVLPGGTTLPFGLNEPRRQDGVVLYTAALAATTRTRDGQELVLEKAEPAPCYPLRIGATFKARVKQVRNAGNSPLMRDGLVLSIGPLLVDRLPRVEVGSVVSISTATVPDLRGAETAIGGGPVLVVGGRVAQLDHPAGLPESSYSFRSMFERHPRSAVGWSDRYFYLVEVDGRQMNLSVGMTLSELATFMQQRLGCTAVMNLDGGGSATCWVNGRTRNSPCDGQEREIANALLVVRKGEGTHPPGGASTHLAAPHVGP